MKRFPEDFKEEKHQFISGGKQWTLHNSKGEAIMSIVGGGSGLYGDGVNTFEMWDYNEDNPRGWQTKEEINEYLYNLNP